MFGRLLMGIKGNCIEENNFAEFSLFSCHYVTSRNIFRYPRLRLTLAYREFSYSIDTYTEVLIDKYSLLTFY